ncbi:hypothetical protein D3C87_1941410 [compost metagenome]
MRDISTVGRDQAMFEALCDFINIRLELCLFGTMKGKLHFNIREVNAITFFSFNTLKNIFDDGGNIGFANTQGVPFF